MVTVLPAIVTRPASVTGMLSTRALLAPLWISNDPEPALTLVLNVSTMFELRLVVVFDGDELVISGDGVPVMKFRSVALDSPVKGLPLRSSTALGLACTQ